MSELTLEHPQTAAGITASIEATMRERYQAPEWALLFGVGNGTGWTCKGWADAIAMNLYPSRGLAIHGFEFKSHRGDWKKELADPGKAENIAKFCDYWWLVAEEGIVHDAELPKGWGHFEHKNGKLRVAVAAAAMKPVDVDRSFVGAVLRRSHQAADSVVEELVRKRIEAADKSRNEFIAREVKRRTEKLTALEEKLREIKDAIGIDLLSYAPADEVVRVLKLVLASDAVGSYNGIAAVVNAAEAFATRVRKVAEEAGFELPTKGARG